MEIRQIAAELEYDYRWIEFGIISEEDLCRQFAEFEADDISIAEHYRCTAFHAFFERTASLTDEQISDYLHIYSTSPDDCLKPNHLHDLVRFRGLTNAQLESLSRHDLFQTPGLARIIHRVQLLRRIAAGQLAVEDISEYLECRDSVVHNALLEHPDLSRENIERLADKGANKGVRNLAKQRLRSYGSKS